MTVLSAFVFSTFALSAFAFSSFVLSAFAFLTLVLSSLTLSPLAFSSLICSTVKFACSFWLSILTILTSGLSCSGWCGSYDGDESKHSCCCDIHYFCHYIFYHFCPPIWSEIFLYKHDVAS